MDAAKGSFCYLWMQQREVSAVHECSKGNFLLSMDAAKESFCYPWMQQKEVSAFEIPQSHTDPLTYMPPANNRFFFITPTTPIEIETLIMSLPNKASNINIIPIFIYKKLSAFLAPLICNIFNSSVSEGTFPCTLKLAKITPIYTSKKYNIVENSRPISVLSVLSKLIEKSVKGRVEKFISSNNILYPLQFDFRSGFDTSDAVLELVDRCSTGLDNKLHTIAIFFDLSKTLDTVNKNIMLGKLELLGFRGIVRDWFESYLSDRRMYVDVNGSNSQIKTVNIGLPQGAVASPWLFSLYVNDMHRCSNKLAFIHFADDTTAFMSGSDLERLCEEVSQELQKVDEWMRANRLSLNVEKTNFMLFTHSHVDRNAVVVRLGNKTITQVKSVKKF